MAHGNLAVNLVTPQGVVAQLDADSVQAPGELGEFELLPGHVPMLAALKPGVLTIGAKARSRYAVSSGYLRVDPGGAVEILVEQAMATAEIDPEKVRVELHVGETELAKWGDKPRDGEYEGLAERVAWARARLDAVAH
jgi:F-type H+-transporting ATPase subunit epsilon